MGSRSHIGVQESDGTITYVYCHWDGYPDHHVPILTSHYATYKLASALVAVGHLSELGESIGEAHDFHNRPDGVCTYYGRDRGDKSRGPSVAKDLDGFDAVSRDVDVYLFADGEWRGKDGRGAWVPAKCLVAP